MFYKIDVLKNFAQFTGQHLCCSHFLKKGHRQEAYNFILKRLQHRYFPVNVAKFLRTPFFTEHLCVTASVVGTKGMSTPSQEETLELAMFNDVVNAAENKKKGSQDSFWLGVTREKQKKSTQKHSPAAGVLNSFVKFTGKNLCGSLPGVRCQLVNLFY